MNTHICSDRSTHASGRHVFIERRRRAVGDWLEHQIAAVLGHGDRVVILDDQAWMQRRIGPATGAVVHLPGCPAELLAALDNGAWLGARNPEWCVRYASDVIKAVLNVCPATDESALIDETLEEIVGTGKRLLPRFVGLTLLDRLRVDGRSVARRLEDRWTAQYAATRGYAKPPAAQRVLFEKEVRRYRLGDSRGENGYRGAATLHAFYDALVATADRPSLLIATAGFFDNNTVLTASVPGLLADASAAGMSVIFVAERPIEECATSLQAAAMSCTWNWTRERFSGKRTSEVAPPVYSSATGT